MKLSDTLYARHSKYSGKSVKQGRASVIKSSLGPDPWPTKKEQQRVSVGHMQKQRRGCEAGAAGSGHGPGSKLSRPARRRSWQAEVDEALEGCVIDGAWSS